MDGFNPNEGKPQEIPHYQTFQPNQGYQQGQQYQPYPQNQYYAGAQPQKPGKGLGIASMICGIAALVLFCMCINIPLAIVALILGIVCLAKKDGAGKGMAIAGIITAAISVLLFFILCGLVFKSIGTIRPSEITEFYEDFSMDGGWNPYDYEYEYDYHFDRDRDYDDYDHDYDHDDDRSGRSW